MKRLRAAPLLALALAACTEATGPKLVASVEILASSVPFDEQTIRVAETVKLSASPRDEAGREIAGRAVRWSSSAPDVASVDTTGLVTGLRTGSALIVAGSDARADTARINVAAPVTGEVQCLPGQTPLSLEVGQVFTTSAWDLGTLCFGGGTAGAEYMLMPFHASSAAGGQHVSVEMAAVGVVPIATTAAIPAAAADEAPLGREDEAFHLRLHERVLPGLTRRARELPVSGGLLPSLSLVAAVPRVGDRMRLNVTTQGSDGCASPVYRTGRVAAVTERAVIVADTANPGGGFTEDEYRAFGTAFDRDVYPLAVEYFGAPSDLDQNQRAVIFFTSAVNDLTTAGSGFYIGGFFFDRDLFPRSGQGACEGSNNAEMFYMMVPDPSRQGREPAFGKENVKANTITVIAHELQHLINASRRLHVNKVGSWEVLWLNEGLSHVAEELLFHRASGLSPRSNEDGSRAAVEPARGALLAHQVSNLERYVQFLRTPQVASPMGTDVLATRGAIWNFLRYASDRRGGTEQTTWHRLANSRTSGVANLKEVFGPDITSWLHDWALSQYLDDSGLNGDPRFQQPSWNFRLLLPRLQTSMQNGSSRYPLRTLQFQGDRFLGLSIPPGTAGYVRLGVAAQRQAAVRVTSGGLPAPRKVQLTVVRTR